MTEVSANGFDSCNSCVCFYIENNKNWSFSSDSDESSYYGTTAKCWTNDKNISYFSTPFQIQIKLNNSDHLSDLRPILYLKVLSYDYWNRLVSESYGFVEIPIRTGRHSSTVKMWKPLIDTPLERMKQFFIGCTPIVHQIHKDLTQISVNLVHLFTKNDI